MFRKTHTRSTKTAEPIGDTFKSNNIAARMGRWSASHWKTAMLRLARVRRRGVRHEHLLPDAD